MKKSLILILGLLAVALVFTGCATASDTEGVEESVVPVTEPVQQHSFTAPSEPAGPAIEAPETKITPKQAKTAGLDGIFASVKKWPENAWNAPETMAPAEDAQYWDDFVTLVGDNSPISEMETYLVTWYGKYGWTPEFYAACHNFYYAKASDTLSTATSEDDIQIVYDSFARCFDATYHGFMQYPDRLDLWCGYVRAALTLGDFDEALNCILAIFNRLDLNDNRWYWRYNEPFYLDDPESVRESEFVQIMHDYICEWLNNDSGLEYAQTVAGKLVEYFPQNPMALNDAALSCLYAGDLEAARPYLEKAVAADPSDMIVVTNLAYVCEDLGDYEASLKYADMMIRSGEEEYVDRGIRLCAEINQLMNPDK